MFFGSRVRPGRPRRVGILKTAGIGDTVLVSAIVRDIVRSGDVEVLLFTGESNAAAARLIEGVKDVVPLPMTQPYTALARMRAYDLDLLIDCGPWPRINAVLAALARARYTVGFRTPGQWRHFPYDARVEHSRTVHELGNYRRLAQAAGFATGELPALGTGSAVPRALLPMRPYVVCHLWSAGYRGHIKEWPTRHWCELIERLVQSGHDVVLTGGPADRDDAAEVLRHLNAASSRVHDLAGKLDLAQTLELLRRSELVISVNTGVMHMAAVIGTPVLSLEGPAPVHRWGPIGENVASVLSPHPGAGFLHLGWEYDGQPTDTMDAIRVDDVYRVALRMLHEEAGVADPVSRGRTAAGRSRRPAAAVGGSSPLAS